MRARIACLTTAVVLLAPGAAEAAPACVLNGTTAELTGEPEFAVVTVNVDQIQVETSSGTVDCGAATTANTDAVVMTAPPDVADNAQAASFPIAGGATDEPGATDEIEIRSVGYPLVFGFGDFGDDSITGGVLPDDTHAANLNAEGGDADADLIAVDAEFLELSGLDGEDVVAADGSAGTGEPSADVDAFGDAGDDTITGGAFLEGGPGDDAITALLGDDLDPAVVYLGGGDVEVVLPGGTLAGKDGYGATDTYTGVTQVFTGGGDDRLTAGDDPATLGGGPGADVLVGGAGDDFLFGGVDDDDVTGGGGDDAIGQHRFEPDGADVMRGGPGFDRVYYGATGESCCGVPEFVGRTEPVFVTIGDGADDGEAGEGDDVRADVEYVRGGSGADTLIGDGGDNRLAGLQGSDTVDGGGGADLVQGDGADAEGLVDVGNVIIGGPGQDELEGSEGADDLRAADGEADSLVCGAGVDFGPFDGGDTFADDCEQRPAPAAPAAPAEPTPPEPTPPGPPAPPPAAVVFPGETGEPQLVRRRAPRLRRRPGGRFRLASGFVVACPANGPDCRIRISLKVRRPGGRLFLTRKTRPITLAAGTELPVARLLTEVASNLVERRGNLTAILRATFRRGGGALVAREAALVLRAPGQRRARAPARSRAMRGGWRRGLRPRDLAARW